MTRSINRLVACAALLIAPTSFVRAQESSARIPIRPLGAITSASKDTIGTQVVVRGLSNGSVLVNDVARRRVLLFDPQLSKFTTVIDSGSATGAGNVGTVAAPSSQLIRYTGDSSLYIDVASMSLLVLDQVGKVARVMALPHPTDALYMALGVSGTPTLDPKGRLVYRGVIQPRPKPPEPGSRIMFSIPVQPDSAPIVRADFDRRVVDTVTTLKAFKQGEMTLEMDSQGNPTLKTTINPLDTGDEWAMLIDGSIAVVRAHDYHIDWVDADGTRRSTPKMPFDWKRLTDEQKQFKIDSVRPVLDKQLASAPAQMIPTADGPRRLKYQIDFVAINKLSDYEPPVVPGSVKPDLNGNLWIVPRTSSGAQGGLLYDVINRKGEIVERVQFPKDYVLAGFGDNGAVYVIRTSDKAAFLERTTRKALQP